MPLQQRFPMLWAAQKSESPELFCRAASEGKSEVSAERVLTPELALRCAEQRAG